MLSWCSYCQHFQGEVPPFDDLAITHGICATCEESALDLTERDLVHTRALQAVQVRLMQAGRRGDVKAVEEILEEAMEARIRHPDILMGILAPMLWQIGEDWKTGVITVADEHRFTAFCEAVFESVFAKVTAAGGMPAAAEPLRYLLVNARGNHHTLAIRLLALWLMDKGLAPVLVHPCPGADDLVALIANTRPTSLLISVALSEHRPSVVALTERVAALPPAIRPRVIVGGYAVKAGLVAPIPGAELMPDINRLSENPSRERAGRNLRPRRSGLIGAG